MTKKDEGGRWFHPNANARQCEKIDDYLSAGLELKRQAWEVARLEFAWAISEAPSSLPHQSRALRVQQAGATLKATTESYMAALGEFNAFVIHGLLPERLK